MTEFIDEVLLGGDDGPMEPGKGPAASSDGAPPPPPPAPAVEHVAAHGIKGKHEIEVHVAGGIIRYFPHDKRFEAVCLKAAHKRDETHFCVLTRYAREYKNPHKGRCVGLMAAWLRLDFLETHSDHINSFVQNSLSQSDRQTARDEVKALPNGLLLCSRERNRRPGELEEPAGVP